MVSPIAISASPCLPPEKLAPGLGSPIAALHLLFPGLALATEAFPYPHFGSCRFSLGRVAATHSATLAVVQS